MSRKAQRDPSRRGIDDQTKLDYESVLSSGEWWAGGASEGNARGGGEPCWEERWCRESRSEEPAPTEPDPSSHYSLPQVEFCDQRRPPPAPQRRPRIADLAKEDKQRIAALVKELARHREDDKNKSNQITSLTEENETLKNKVNKLEREVSCFQLTLKYSEENYKAFNKSLSEKEKYLREQNSELQNKLTVSMKEKTELESKLKECCDQTEKLTKAIYNISMENKLLNKKYEHTKEKLRNALEAVNKLEAEYSQLSHRSTESRRTQTEPLTEIIRSKRKTKDGKKESPRFRRGKTWKYESWDRDSSDENSLISELFFIPKQKNLSKSQYTTDEDSF